MILKGWLWILKTNSGLKHQEWNEVAQLCPTLCNPMDCSPPASSIHGIFQARVLEWGAIAFSRGSSRLRDRTLVSHFAGRGFTSEPPGKPQTSGRVCFKLVNIKFIKLWKQFLVCDYIWTFTQTCNQEVFVPGLVFFRDVCLDAGINAGSGNSGCN